jgi:hypothetical protein
MKLRKLKATKKKRMMMKMMTRTMTSQRSTQNSLRMKKRSVLKAQCRDPKKERRRM